MTSTLIFSLCASHSSHVTVKKNASISGRTSKTKLRRRVEKSTIMTHTLVHGMICKTATLSATVSVRLYRVFVAFAECLEKTASKYKI